MSVRNPRLALDPNRCPAMVQEELPNWLARVNAMRQEEHNRRGFSMQLYPVEVAGGRKYIKLIYTMAGGNQRSVYCFVRAEDGAILKAASWKAPALNYVRGSIFDQKLCVGPHGVIY